MDPLITTRKAATIMNEATKRLGFGNLATHFDGDDPDQWQIYDAETIFVTFEGRRQADIFVTNQTAPITVMDARELIRQEHRSKFNHRSYGIQDIPPTDVLGYHDPQLVITCSWPGDNDVPHYPRRYLPRRPGRRNWQVKRQYQVNQ